MLANFQGGSGNSLAAYQSEDLRITTTRFKVSRAFGEVVRLTVGHSVRLH